MANCKMYIIIQTGHNLLITPYFVDRVSFLDLFFIQLRELILYWLGIFPYSFLFLGLLIWVCLVHLAMFRDKDNQGS